MRHEARQVPSWLIFDVRQKMKILSALSLVISSVALVVALRSPRLDPTLSSLMSLQNELEAVQERLRASEMKLAELAVRSEKLGTSIAARATQMLPSTLPDAAIPALPLLVDGAYAVEQGAVIYDPNARLRLGNDLEVSSPTGVMVSNIDQSVVVGELTVKSSAGIVRAVGAAIDVPNQTMTAKQITFTSNLPSFRFEVRE